MMQNIRLIRKQLVAKGTVAFYFEKPAGFEYRAGQNCDFYLINPTETDPEGNKRCFSFITAPFENELGFATRMRDTAFKRVLGSLSAGGEIQMEGPYGDYTLHKTATTPAVFLIGGIGITPVLSILKQAAFEKSNHSITLIYSNRTPEDSPFRSDLEQLAAQNSNFKYVPVFTQYDNPDYQGERGHIDETMIKRYVNDVTSPIYYLSGPEPMVKAMRQLLISINANEDNIRTEEFPGY